MATTCENNKKNLGSSFAHFLLLGALFWGGGEK